ncbi:uncharacterized protein [Amphiura filiformis]|uniref:uncharacterized protein n=1 Tax=Amphiura filiformis TaxID=82378 RepID=UPI003B225FFD
MHGDDLIMRETSAVRRKSTRRLPSPSGQQSEPPLQAAATANAILQPTVQSTGTTHCTAPLQPLEQQQVMQMACPQPTPTVQSTSTTHCMTPLPPREQQQVMQMACPQPTPPVFNNGTAHCTVPLPHPGQQQPMQMGQAQSYTYGQTQPTFQAAYTQPSTMAMAAQQPSASPLMSSFPYQLVPPATPHALSAPSLPPMDLRLPYIEDKILHALQSRNRFVDLARLPRRAIGSSRTAPPAKS